MYLRLRNNESIVIESDREVVTLKSNPHGIIGIENQRKKGSK